MPAPHALPVNAMSWSSLRNYAKCCKVAQNPIADSGNFVPLPLHVAELLVFRGAGMLFIKHTCNERSLQKVSMRTCQFALTQSLACPLGGISGRCTRSKSVNVLHVCIVKFAL